MQPIFNVGSPRAAAHCLSLSQQPTGWAAGLGLYSPYQCGCLYGVVVIQEALFKLCCWRAVGVLCCAVQGAGMMAIPKAFMLLGLIPGSILMLAIACLTYFTLAGRSRQTSADACWGMQCRAGAAAATEHLGSFGVHPAGTRSSCRSDVRCCVQSLNARHCMWAAKITSARIGHTGLVLS